MANPKVKEIEIPGPTVIKPEIIYKDTGSTKRIEIPAGPIDSLAVVTAYYTKRPFFFQDTVQEVALRFDAVLFENRLLSPELTLHNFRQPVIQENWSLWGDASLGNQRIYLGASFQKEANRFGAGYNMSLGAFELSYSRRLFVSR